MFFEFKTFFSPCDFYYTQLGIIIPFIGIILYVIIWHRVMRSSAAVLTKFLIFLLKIINDHRI